MRGLLIAAAAMAGAAALAGCETGPPMSAAECQVADWGQVGFQDGASGRPASRFVALEQACAMAGLPADQERYLAGRASGLRDFCQPGRAFQLGLSGASYGGVCPPELDNAFRYAFSDGARAYSALEAVRSVESTINSLHSEIDDLEHKIQANELGYERSQSDAERQRHRDELERLRGERRNAVDRLRDAERDRYWRARDLDRVRLDLGFQYGSW